MTRPNHAPASGIAVLLAILFLFPIVAGAEEIEAIYYDYFDDPSSGWLTESGDTGSVQYRNGKYQVRITRDYYVWWSWAPYEDVPDNFLVEATGYARAGSGFSKYGLIWGTDSANFLLFYVTPTGWFSVRSMVGGEWQAPPIDWKESSSIQTGENTSNTLRVTLEGVSVVVSINRRRVGSFELGGAGDLAAAFASPGTVTLNPGHTWRIGLAGASFDDTPVDFYFGEFSLYELPSDSPHPPTVNFGG